MEGRGAMHMTWYYLRSEMDYVLYYLSVMSIMYRHTLGQTLSLQGSSSSVQLGDSFQFNCTVTRVGSLQGALSFQRLTGTVVATCAVNSATCEQFSNSPGLSCGCVTGQTKIFYTNIASVRRNDSDGNWRCQYNNINSNNISLDVQYAPVITSVPSNEDVTENTSPNIDCSSNITPGNPSTTSYRWTGPGGYSKDEAVLDRLVTRTQGGVYTCTATNTAGLSGTAQVNIYVQYAPVITSVPSNKDVTENTSPNIDCSSNITPGNPSTTSYRWTGPGGYSKDGAVLDRLVTRTQGGVYTCTATNTPGLSDTAQVNINVQYGPGTSVSITPSSPHTVVEGTGPVSITCTADCNPTCGLRLRKGNTDVGQGQVSLDKVNRTQAGDYTCVAANGIGNASKLFTLVVYYEDSPSLTFSKPQVLENATVSLACSVSSNPTSQMTIRHVDNDTVLLTEVTNSGQYVIHRVQCLHNGTYQCSADNTQIPGTKTTSASLDVLCSPRHDYRRNLTLTLARNINETATMVVDVIANPLPNFTWWRSSDDQLEPINNSTVHTVSNSDLQTTLQFNVTQTRDYGKYALKMENSQGAREIVFTLTGKSRPYPPSSLGVLAGQTSAALSWISNFNGGAPQTYFLEYRSLASSWRNSSESGIHDPGRNRLVTYNITGLAHSTFYEFRLYSVNTYGTSDVLMINTTSLIVDQQGPGFPVAAAAGGISAALLVIIIVAAVVLLYKRGVCATKEKRSGDVALFENDQRDREKPEMYDNDLYTTSGLSQATRKKPEMEDNVLYAGSGDVKGAASDGDVYAVVKNKQKDVKPKKGKDVPKKQHKGKGKGKNSDGQKTRRNQQSRGDVYVNTVPGEFADGNTYANAGFEGDESTSETANDEKPSYGRNEDGLLYVGIDFGSHTPSQTINRSEESTEYAGIAFGQVGPQPPQDEEEQK